MKKNRAVLMFLLLYHLNALSLEIQSPDNRPPLLELSQEILQDGIFRRIVVPEPTSFAKFQAAKRDFNSLTLVCTTLKKSCESINVKLYDKKTNTELVQPIREYLKNLKHLASRKNKLRRTLIPEKIKLNASPEQLKIIGELERYVPNEKNYPNNSYPKLSLYLFNYLKLASELKKIHISDPMLQERAELVFPRIASESRLFDKYIAMTKSDFLRLLNNLHDPNQRDTEGRTPLYYAITNPECSEKRVKHLKDNGASLEDIDGEGNNALQIAQAIDSKPIPEPCSYNDKIEANKKKKIELLQQYYYFLQKPVQKKTCIVQ